MPVADILDPGALEMARQSGTGLQPGLLGPRPEPQREVGDAIGKDQLRHARHVAGVRRGVGPGHPAVRREILPAVRGADVADALARRARVRGEGERSRAVPGEQHGPTFVRAGPGAVMEAAESQVRRKQRIQAEGMRAAIGIRCVARIIEARLDVDDVRVVVGADAQGQRVAGMTVGGDDRGDARLQGAHLARRVPLHLAPEPVVVGDDEPQVADLGPVHPWPVDLVQDPVTDGEPHPAREVGRPDRVLLAARPGGRGAWRPRRMRGVFAHRVAPGAAVVAVAPGDVGPASIPTITGSCQRSPCARIAVAASGPHVPGS